MQEGIDRGNGRCNQAEALQYPEAPLRPEVMYGPYQVRQNLSALTLSYKEMLSLVRSHSTSCFDLGIKALVHAPWM